jgi:RNA polymerase sigma factor for flagellar operon FliA
MDKTVLSLYYVEGLNLREIGEVFGVTETRISQIRSRALGRLRARLAEWRRDGKPDGSR